MATKASILQRSKKVETRVARFLFGEAAARDWKELSDISGDDADGRRWIGEVKSYAWPAGPARLLSILGAALEQAERHSDRAFAVLVPTNCQVENALVMLRREGIPVVMVAGAFRGSVLGLGEAE